MEWYTDGKNVDLLITKKSDGVILDALWQIDEEGPFKIERIILVSKSAKFKETLVGRGYPDELHPVFSLNSSLIDSFDCRFDNAIQLTLTRQPNDLKDKATIALTHFDKESVKKPKPTELALFVSLVKKLLESIDMASIGTILGKEIEQYYQVREAELQRLESLAIEITDRTTHYRSQLDDDFKQRQNELSVQTESIKKRLYEEHEKQKAKLDEWETELERREEEIDNRDSKHARRQIRQDLKTEFIKRSERFELTQGTQCLRKPIFYFTILLLTIFGIGMAVSFAASLLPIWRGTELKTLDLINLVVKQVLFAVAFGTTSVFFIRWNNKWLESHAKEEFYLKRLELDVDRASWVVEMALEWKDEKGTEIPKELIDRLTLNLFNDNKSEEDLLHPADQLASALLGSASGASLKLPYGEVCFDRKSMKSLGKQSETDNGK